MFNRFFGKTAESQLQNKGTVVTDEKELKKSRREEKTVELEVPTKHLWLRVVLFVLALTIAVSAFTYGIVSIGKKAPGFYTIEAAADEDAMLYASGIRFKYYFEGSSNSIKSQIKKVTDVYSKALMRAYKHLDAENTYPGYIGIATLNKKIGEETEVSEELYNILLDASTRCTAESGYDLFNGALYEEWQTILMSSYGEEYDPANKDSGTAERLSVLAEKRAVANITLTFTDREKHKLRLDADPDYIAFLRENEYSDKILNLGVLHDAYMIREVVAALEKEGYNAGYITANSGLTVALSGYSGGEYCLIVPTEDDNEKSIGAVGITEGSAAFMFRAFPMYGGEQGYYTVVSGGRQYYRHPFFNNDGSFSDVILSSLSVSLSGDAVETVYGAVMMNHLKTASEVSEKITELKCDKFIYTLISDSAPVVYGKK